MAKIIKAKISELVPDDKNANKGTERGDWMLERSLSKFGAGRSILLDKNLRIIGGNKTSSKFGELGLENVVIVQTTGDELVAVQRVDIDLDSPQGRELALADNRVGEINLDWDLEVLTDLDTEIDMRDWIKPHELEEMVNASQQAIDDADAEDPDEPLFDPERYPLAIVLDWKEKQVYDDAKRAAGYKKDKDFLMFLVEGHHG